MISIHVDFDFEGFRRYIQPMLNKFYGKVFL